MNERDKLLLAGFAAGQDRTPESAIAMAEARAASTYQEPEKLDDMVPRSRLNAVDKELAEAKAKIKEVQENAWGLIEEFQKKLDALEASKVPANYPSVVTPEGDRGPVALNTLADELWNRLDGIDEVEVAIPVEFCRRVITALRSLKPQSAGELSREELERKLWQAELRRDTALEALEQNMARSEDIAQQLIRNLLAAEPVGQPNRFEYCWLIETNKAASVPYYATGLTPELERWTKEPYKAVRFSSERAANDVRSQLYLWSREHGGYLDAKAIEHGFALPPAQPEPTGDAAHWKAMYERERQAVFQAGRLLEGARPEALENVAMMLRRMAYKMRHSGNDGMVAMAAIAVKLLTKYGLQGSPLRQSLGIGEDDAPAGTAELQSVGQPNAALADDAARWRAIIELAGYWQDGSDQTVKLHQDDATRTCIIEAGKQSFLRDGCGFNAAANLVIAALRGRQK